MAKRRVTSTKKASVKPGRNLDVVRTMKTAEFRAQGMSHSAAMVAAGYSPVYANKNGYKHAKRPFVQSIFTDGVESIMAELGVEFREIVRPYVKALKAKVIAKSAFGAKETRVEDLFLQMQAADRLVDLYGGKPKEIEMPPPAQQGLTVIIAKEGAKVQVNQGLSMEQAKAAQIEATGPPTAAPMPKVTLKKG